MPIFDMSIDKLKKYKGSTPRPDDFKNFWNDGLKEISHLDPEPEYRKIDFPALNAEVYDLFFTGVKNARIHALHIRPKNIKTPGPAIIEFHGYSGSHGDIAPKLKWIQQGYSVFSLDVRGQGGKSEDPGGVIGNTLRGHIIRGIEYSQSLLFRQVFLDGVLLVRLASACSFVDKKSLATTGGSQGGGLALAVAALCPEIGRCAAQFPFLGDYYRAWELNCGSAFEEIREWFRRFDPEHKREKEIFNRLGYIDVHNLAPMIKAQVLTCVCLEDNSVPPSTVFSIYNNIKSKKEIVIYPDFKHESILGWEDRVFCFLSEL
ncbi:MAG: acetylesterase [Spirochaetes bacterium GWF1_41_5]|nr:MAG: acetylesterase [Spirochaetes bacterium GWF1_41_5]HBE04296.1 acetylesterase [Spirochaetia bacterium]